MIEILGPDGRTETHLGVVGAGNNVVLVLPREEGHDGAERLLGDDARVLGWTIDNGRGNEVAGLVFVLAANSNAPLLLLDVAEEGLDLLKLHAVLHGTQEDALLVALAGLDRLGELDSFVTELLVDVFVNVYTLDGKADLAGVEEGEGGNFLSGGYNIDVLADNGWVVAAELEGDTLEGLGCGLHDLLASDRGTSEGDLGWAGVGCEHWSEIIAA